MIFMADPSACTTCSQAAHHGCFGCLLGLDPVEVSIGGACRWQQQQAPGGGVVFMWYQLHRCCT
jgi:hypothetical protein